MYITQEKWTLEMGKNSSITTFKEGPHKGQRYGKAKSDGSACLVSFLPSECERGSSNIFSGENPSFLFMLLGWSSDTGGSLNTGHAFMRKSRQKVPPKHE
jgi:hypothetical protein